MWNERTLEHFTMAHQANTNKTGRDFAPNNMCILMYSDVPWLASKQQAYELPSLIYILNSYIYL